MAVSWQVRLLLVAGPSSSGKTTFAAKLAHALAAHGCPSIALSCDNFYAELSKACSFPTRAFVFRSRALFRRGHARPRAHTRTRTRTHARIPLFLFCFLLALLSAPPSPAYTPPLPCPPLPSAPLPSPPLSPNISPSPSLPLLHIGPTWDNADLIIQVPLTPAGKPDFETVDALDSQRLTDDLISILSGEVTEIPRYSFKDNNPLPRQAHYSPRTPCCSHTDRLA